MRLKITLISIFVMLCAMLSMTVLLAVTGSTKAAGYPSSTQFPAATESSSDLVISQIYGAGGTAGATYNASYIELFNRTKTSVDINHWGIQYSSGSTAFTISFTSNVSIRIPPGEYMLLQIGPEGANGAPLPVSPEFSIPGPVSVGTTGKLTLIRNTATAPAGACPIPDPAIADFVGYGSGTTCFEGTGPVQTLSNTKAAVRNTGGCTDTDDNAADFSVSTPVPHNSQSKFNPCASAKTIQLGAASYFVNEADGIANINVMRTGDTTGAATVDYTTSDGTARQRSDYTFSSGTLSFAPNEASKSFSVLITNNAHVDGNRTINLSLSNPVGASLASPSQALLTITDNDVAQPLTNPIDDAPFFVRQQYADFLNRAPDAGGLGYWSNEINKCGSDAQCRHDRRVGVADAFFFEAEFQQTGAFIYRIYKAGLGTRPTYAQFIADRGRVLVGAGLDQSKTAFALTTVQRDTFLGLYPRSMTADQFVDALINSVKQHSGVDFTAQRGALISLYDGTDNGRAAILKQIAETGSLIDAEYNQCFVLMEYFGYMRRDPDQGGFDFWLSQVNKFPLRNVDIQHAMACSFITSDEYQTRFGSVVTHTNRECPQ
jgi:hypothetical protein